MSDITKAQYSLAVKAKYNQQHRFEHLYRLICREPEKTEVKTKSKISSPSAEPVTLKHRLSAAKVAK
jgi:hypothetical protein